MRVQVEMESKLKPKMSPALNDAIHPVNVVLVAFCALDRTGGADASILLSVGNAA